MSISHRSPSLSCDIFPGTHGWLRRPGSEGQLCVFPFDCSIEPRTWSCLMDTWEERASPLLPARMYHAKTWCLHLDMSVQRWCHSTHLEYRTGYCAGRGKQELCNTIPAGCCAGRRKNRSATQPVLRRRKSEASEGTCSISMNVSATCGSATCQDGLTVHLSVLWHTL